MEVIRLPVRGHWWNNGNGGFRCSAGNHAGSHVLRLGHNGNLGWGASVDTSGSLFDGIAGCEGMGFLEWLAVGARGSLLGRSEPCRELSAESEEREKMGVRKRILCISSRREKWFVEGWVSCCVVSL